MESSFRKTLRYFFSGMLFIVPVAATGYVIYISFTWLDNLLGIPYPGVGFVIIIAAITVFGYLTSNLAFQTLTTWLDHIINRIPMVKLIYSSIRDLIGAFVGDKKKFNKPVWVCVNRNPEVWRIGFLTQEDLTHLGQPGKSAVYLPHSYAISGYVLIADKDMIKPVIGMSAAEAMKFAVSGGVTGAEEEEQAVK